jgi:hypothetical protein
MLDELLHLLKMSYDAAYNIKIGQILYYGQEEIKIDT